MYVCVYMHACTIYHLSVQFISFLSRVWPRDGALLRPYGGNANNAWVQSAVFAVQQFVNPGTRIYTYYRLMICSAISHLSGCHPCISSLSRVWPLPFLGGWPPPRRLSLLLHATIHAVLGGSEREGKRDACRRGFLGFPRQRTVVGDIIR